jgi:DNA-binding HxlR family transcriptional regulator
LIPITDAEIAGCPIREVVAGISTKWSMLVLLYLSRQDLRFAALRQTIPDISQRVLTATLRKLRRDGLIWRSVKPTIPPQVTYGLTPLGMSLISLLGGLADWADRNQAEIEASRRAYEAAPD